MRLRLLLVLTCLVLGSPPLFAQGDRRDRRAPELIIESGGRLGTCDQLLFTSDGKHLLAAGDDKVVRLWQVGPEGLLSASPPVLRWSIWKEKRGAIYALALSPDKDRRFVAVAGFGLGNGDVAVIDRQTGVVQYQSSAPVRRGERTVRSIRALAFAPSGKRLAIGSEEGRVWLWDLAEEKPVLLGAHPTPGKDKVNYVRLLHFFEEETLLSVPEQGSPLRWTRGQKDPLPLTVWPRGGGSLYRVVLSPDGKWLAGAEKQLAADNTRGILVCSLNGTRQQKITLADGQFGRSLAFAPDGRMLAVGVGNIPPESRFHLERDEEIRLYDLDRPRPALVRKLPHSGRVEALAFHPDGRLAVAGGNDHEVTLWQPTKPHRQSVQVGAGRCIWQVALSRDGQFVGYRDQRNSTSEDPNAGGAGPWQVFDLGKRQFSSDKRFTPARPLPAPPGWSVQPDPDSRYRWYAVHEDGRKLELGLDPVVDGMPHCYTFLPAEGREPRLAVGHYNGVSIFSLGASRAARARIFTGHQGEVTSLAVAPSGKWMISGSNDQTIAAWDLTQPDGQSELGATFEERNGRLYVRKVALFSPGWEAGLIEGEEVVLLVVGGSERVYISEGVAGFGPPVGTAAAARKRLLAPEPGKELAFLVRPAGKGEEPRPLLTRLFRRPLWRFFPTRTREWVLWTGWHNYYDTSENGDFFVGWQVNKGKEQKGTPTFYPAEQLRSYFHRPAVLDLLLAERDPPRALAASGNDLAPVQFGRMEPPAVRLRMSTEVVSDEDPVLTLVADPGDDNPDRQPRRVELWINDYRYKVWQPTKRPFNVTFTLPRTELRMGANALTLQCYNSVAGRGEGRAEVVRFLRRTGKPPSRRLFGLMVGIRDYSRSVGTRGKRLLEDLQAPFNDAKAMRAAWLEHKDDLYAEAQIDLLPGKDGEAGRKAILASLDRIAKQARPDDQVVVFLAGHGFLIPQKHGPGHFVFCCPDFDLRNLAETSVSSREISEKLAAIRCRKLVLLDACHSGDVAMPIRDLTPGGCGPIIFAACGRGELSWEDPRLGEGFSATAADLLLSGVQARAATPWQQALQVARLKEPGGLPATGGHGLFTYAILRTIDERFREAARNKVVQLDAWELFDYLEERLPALLKALHLDERAQNPVKFPYELKKDPYLDPLLRIQQK
jgi:WD40 repeat protein